jgi:hypothetical protein
MMPTADLGRCDVAVRRRSADDLLVKIDPVPEQHNRNHGLPRPAIPAALIALAALAAPIAGCSVISQPAGTEEPFPNLGAIPAGQPPSSSPEERQALADQLAADRLEAERLEAERLEADRAKTAFTGAPKSGSLTDHLD